VAFVNRKRLPPQARVTLWPKTQVRLPPELRDLLALYATLVGTEQTRVLRAILKAALAQAFGKGRTASEVKQHLSNQTQEAREGYAIAIRSHFERLLE
jgi:hypothetical protein